jgi:hypothetical protein
MPEGLLFWVWPWGPLECPTFRALHGIKIDGIMSFFFFFFPHDACMVPSNYPSSIMEKKSKNDMGHIRKQSAKP